MKKFKQISCLCCGKKFNPNNSRNKHCSWQCRFREKFDTCTRRVVSGCLEWPILSKHGNRAIWSRASGDCLYVSRVLWELEREEIPDGLLILHKCDNPSCVEIEHLFLGMQVDNVKDMIAKGRKAVLSKENHPLSKIDKWGSEFIKHWLDSGYSVLDIAEVFNVSVGPINQIRNGKHWTQKDA